MPLTWDPQQFFTVPHETVRASLRVLEIVHAERLLPTGTPDPHETKEWTLIQSILDDPQIHWPLSIESNAILWTSLQTVITQATAQYNELLWEDPHEVVDLLSKYLVACPDFFAKSNEVSRCELRERGKGWTIVYPGYQKQIGEFGEWEGSYEEYDLEDPESMEVFDKIMAAARLKSASFPHPSIRQVMNKGDEDGPLFKIPDDLASFIEARSADYEGFVNVGGFDDQDAELVTTVGQAWNMAPTVFSPSSEEDDARSLPGVDTPSDQPTDWTAPREPLEWSGPPGITDWSTPFEALDMSSSSSEPSGAPEIPVLDVSYSVTFSAAGEKVTHDIGYRHGFHNADDLVRATKDLWGWVNESRVSAFSLDDVVKQADKMVKKPNDLHELMKGT